MQTGGDLMAYCFSFMPVGGGMSADRPHLEPGMVMAARIAKILQEIVEPRLLTG